MEDCVNRLQQVSLQSACHAGMRPIEGEARRVRTFYEPAEQKCRGAALPRARVALVALVALVAVGIVRRAIEAIRHAVAVVALAPREPIVDEALAIPVAGTTSTRGGGG